MALPKKVHESHGRYYYVHAGKWHPLTRVSEGEAALRNALAALLSPRPTTFDHLFDHWLAAEHDLAPRTVTEYTRIIDTRLRRHFGRAAVWTLRPSHVAQYLEKRGGVKANREMAVLGSVCEWAMRQGWLENNPCRGVRRNRERARHRYVTDAELYAASMAALPEVRDLLWGAYLTGLRQGDLRRMTAEHLQDEGIVLTEGKRSKRIICEWTPRLRETVDLARSRSADPHVFTNSQGRPWTLWGVQSAMRRLGVDWTFHDLRAKAESDHAQGVGLLTSYKRAWRYQAVR